MLPKITINKYEQYIYEKLVLHLLVCPYEAPVAITTGYHPPILTFLPSVVHEISTDMSQHYHIAMGHLSYMPNNHIRSSQVQEYPPVCHISNYFAIHRTSEP